MCATLAWNHKSLINHTLGLNNICRARRCDHISPLLQSLHWLRVADRITFRLAVLTYRCLHSSAPEYLSRQLQRVSDVQHVNDFVLRRPLLWLFRGPVEPPSAVDVSLLLRPQSGTACQKQSVLQYLCRCSESHWRRNCSRDPTLTNLITN